MINPPLMPHQEKAVAELSNGKILKGGTGSGKTRTAMAYYVRRTAPWAKLYVITTAMKRDSGDWEEEARIFGCDIVVDSWNNLSNYEEITDAFFIFDEQRVVGSGSWVKSFLKITKRNEWILLSATPGDTWLDYAPVFIANGYYKNKREFIEEHVVYVPYLKFPKVQRILGAQRLSRQLSEILVAMDFKRHTTRHEIEKYVEYDRDLYNTVWMRRWNYLEERPIRQVSELFSLLRRVVNSDLSRKTELEKLLVKHPRIIVFYNFDYELEILRSIDTPKAEWNGHRHEPIPSTERWMYMVQYSAGAEGWNCISTDTVVFYSPTYSYRAFEQAKGRIDRLNTPYTDLYYYVLRSPSVIDCVILLTLARKKNFNESAALKSMAGGN